MNGKHKSGRAVFEANGKTSWEWQTSTGVFERHISDEQMSKIAAPDLQVVEYSEPDSPNFEGRLWNRG